MKEFEFETEAIGRVEFIGNHTDYNEGYVIAAGIEAKTTAKGNTLENKIKFYSEQIENLGDDQDPDFEIGLEVLTESVSLSPQEFVKILDQKSVPKWARYPLGVAYFLQRDGLVTFDKGFEINYAGDLDFGSGLSSSASFEVVTWKILKEMFPFEQELKDAALLCQSAENKIAGAPCGNMDQFSILNGDLTYIDCRTLDHKNLELPEGWEIAVLNTGVYHDVSAKKGFPTRRKESEKAAKYLGVKFLRDANIDLYYEKYEEHKERLADSTFERYYKRPLSRAFHVINENNRVREVKQSLIQYAEKKEKGKAGIKDENRLYRILENTMRASHESSSDYFNNSSKELDIMARLAWKEGLAARLSGGGFGGSVIAIIKDDAQKESLNKIVRLYEEKTGIKVEPKPYKIVKGAFHN
jgi:galactokinase